MPRDIQFQQGINPPIYVVKVSLPLLSKIDLIIYLLRIVEAQKLLAELPIVGMMDGSGEQREVAQVKVPYEVVWDNSENGYIWKSIVVEEQYLNDEFMATLGKQLHAEFGKSTFAKVAVFKTEQSAALFAEAQKDPYSKKLNDAYDADCVALYSLNSNTDYEEFVYHLQGLDGKQVELSF